ncbi:UDP-glycosyltransferase UGT5-like [Drosophila tropicalis]|uniref:UDP-glycosyltransferase UGT5-like n=1 Tax=Drosophila tropicalis TaxID=46794 RepID=UPI0035ABB8D5
MLASKNPGPVWLLIVIIGISFHYTQADHILAIFSYAFSSPYLVVWPLIKELVDRGHQVTVISGQNHFPTIDGTHHIHVHMIDNPLQELFDSDTVLETLSSKWKKSSYISKFYYYTTLNILNNLEVQQLLHNTSAKFDMVIINTPASDALSGFAHHFNAPMVGISAYSSAWIIDYLAGNSEPSVYEPMSPESYMSGSPSFFERLNNWIGITEEWLLERLVLLPPQMKLYREFFNDSYSNFDEIRRNYSLILVNQHFSLGRVRSNVPNLIEVAGMHLCHHKNCNLDPMPLDLQRFLDEAERGAIYFSMGLEILVKWLPNNTKQALLEIFSKLKERVVWKLDDCESLQNKSDNIYVRSFMPQQQILQHPKVKLFITNAGLLSIIETAYYGVPVLCLPLYFDQFANAKRMNLAGAGETINFISISFDKLNQSIQELLRNPSYARNAKEISTRFRDQPMNPVDTAVWWTEYVLRHKGGPHMRIAEQDISFMKYYKLDLIPIVFGRIGLPAIVVILLAYRLINWVASQLDLRLSIVH